MLVALNDGEAAQSPQTLPGGQHLLFTLATGSAPDRWDKARIVVQSLTSGERKTVFEGGSACAVCTDGSPRVRRRRQLVRGGVRRRAAEGDERCGADDRRCEAGSARRTSGGIAQFSFASNGSLIYIPGAVSARWDLALTDRKGGVEPLKLPPGAYEVPRVSPDGRRIAFGTDDGKEAIVWIYELSGATAMKAAHARKQQPVSDVVVGRQTGGVSVRSRRRCRDLLAADGWWAGGTSHEAGSG